MRLPSDCVVAINFPVGFLANVHVLCHSGKVLGCIVVAYASGDFSILGEGVVKLEAHYAAYSFRVFMCLKPVGNGLERIFSVEVVAIDDCEWLVYDIFCHEHGVSRPPRFLSFRVQRVFGWNLVELLNHEIELQRGAVRAFHARVFLPHCFFELILEILPDYVDNLSESSINCIEDRVIDDSLSARAEAVHLFQSAVTAAHSSSQNEKCRFHWLEILLSSFHKFSYFCANNLRNRGKVQRHLGQRQGWLER